MDDDFNTAGALGHLYDLVKAINTARDAGVAGPQFDQAQAALLELSGVLGLRLTPDARHGFRRRSALHRSADRAARGTAPGPAMGADRPDPRPPGRAGRGDRRQPRGYDLALGQVIMSRTRQR